MAEEFDQYPDEDISEDEFESEEDPDKQGKKKQDGMIERKKEQMNERASAQ